MPRRSASGSIRKKTKTVNGKTYSWWEARYTTGSDPGTGKQLQQTITGKTQKEVAQKLRDALHSIDTGTYHAPDKTILSKWLKTWSEEYLVNQKPLTVQTYKRIIENHITPAIGSLALQSIKVDHLQKFYNGLTLSPKTIKNIHGVLHKALSQAHRNGIIAANPADHVILPKIQKPDLSVLDLSQIRAYLAAAKSDPYCDILTFILLTGCRRGEALGLCWDCVDLSAGTVHIRRQLQQLPTGYSLQSPKSGKGRVLCPSPSAMAALSHALEFQAAAQKTNQDVYDNQQGYVFTNALGGHLTRSALDRHHKAILAAAGLPDIRLHDLRHSYAVLSLTAGDDIKTVQDNLGHATASFTLDVYAHALASTKRAASSRLESLLNDPADENNSPSENKKPSPNKGEGDLK